jgi:MFS transporter, DHA3 family, tetracycline resistance protein
MDATMRLKLPAAQIFMVLQLVTAFTLYLWLTIQPVYHIELVGLTAAQLVLIGTAHEGTVLLFEVPTSIIADTYSRRVSILISLFISGIALILEASFPSFGMIVIANIIWGFGWTFLSGANVAWVTDEIGEETANPLLLQTSQWSQVANLLGIVASVALGKIALFLPILVGGIITLILGLFLMLTMRETNFVPPEKHKNPFSAMGATLMTGIATVRLRPILLLIILLGGMRGLWVGGFERLWTLFLIQQYTFPIFAIATWIGMIKAGVMLLSIFSIGTVRKRLKAGQMGSPARTLHWLYTLIILSSIGFALVGQLWLAIVLFLINQTALATCRPLFIAWINQHAESRIRATMISMYWQSVSLANVIGGPIVGWIATIRTLQQALVAASLAMSPALPLFRHAKNKEQSAISSV